MLIVPLTGDVITVLGDVKYTVLSYSAYANKPVVYVGAGAGPIAVLFEDILQINGTPVKLNSSKIFVADSLIQRKLHLPQINDKVIFKDHTSKIKSVKLFERGNVASGIQIIGSDIDTHEQTSDRLMSVSKIELAGGPIQIQSFFKIYRDYVGAR